MLNLTRNIHERIMIGDDIIIEVVDIRRASVRIGISAPVEILIAREELLDRVPERYKTKRVSS